MVPCIVRRREGDGSERKESNACTTEKTKGKNHMKLRRIFVAAGMAGVLLTKSLLAGDAKRSRKKSS